MAQPMTERNTNSVLKYALQLAKHGFYVFPVVANTKLPAIEDWPNKATRDTDQISTWFSTDRNIGIATGKFGDGQHLCVLDIDMKNGKNGENSLDLLTIADDLPNTMENKTPSDVPGRHIVFTTDKPFKNGVDVLGEGIDIRAVGGYIVAPGSSIGGKFYKANGKKPAELPSWLAEKISIAKPKTNVVELDIKKDQPHNVERAIHYLEITADIAVEGEGGDMTTFAVACTVMDFGLSPQGTYEAMRDHWNNRCDPPWDLDGEGSLKQKVKNAVKHRENAVGCKSAEVDFGGDLAIPDYMVRDIERKKNPNSQPYRQGNMYVVNAGDVTVANDAEPLIENLIDQGGFGVMYGQSNTGKSFMALDFAKHVATGQPWNDCEVERGGVLYLAAEAGRGIMKRVKALTDDLNDISLQALPMQIMPCPVNLLTSDADLKAITDFVTNLEEQAGIKCRLIVVDTLARSFIGGDENSTSDMSKFVSNVDRLKHDTNAAVLVVHHSGKDQSRGARGAYALKAGIDSEMEIIAKDNHADAIRTLKVHKQRDNKIIDDVNFSLAVKLVGQDSKGRDITTCVVVKAGQSEFDNIDVVGGMMGDEAAALAALHYACKGSHHIDGKVDVKVFAAYFARTQEDIKGLSLRSYLKENITSFGDIRVVPVGHYGDTWKRQFKRVRDNLGTKGYVEVNHQNQWFIKNGDIRGHFGDIGDISGTSGTTL